MTREKKILKKKARAKARADKRNSKWREICEKANSKDVPTRVIRYPGSSWYDPTSSTGYRQVCDYFGHCESPCNGDC